LAGITSFGSLCSIHDRNIDRNQQELYSDYYETFTEAEESDKNIYGVYTNVASYVKWIAENSDYTGCQISKYLQKCYVL